MTKLFTLKKLLATVLAVMTLAVCMSTTAWAAQTDNNHKDVGWSYSLSYKDSVTAARAKEDSSASYVKYESGDLQSIRTAIYAYNGRNVTTEDGNVAIVQRGNSEYISNTGYTARNDHMVCLHLCTIASNVKGNAMGKWSPDNYRCIP